MQKFARALLISTLLSFPHVTFAGEKTVPNVIDEEMAKTCKFVGVVNSVRMGTSATKALNGALEGAMQKAEKLGANSIVVKSSTPQGSFMTVMASAYSCPSQPPTDE